MWRQRFVTASLINNNSPACLDSCCWNTLYLHQGDSRVPGSEQGHRRVHVNYLWKYATDGNNKGQLPRGGLFTPAKSPGRLFSERNVDRIVPSLCFCWRVPFKANLPVPKTNCSPGLSASVSISEGLACVRAY